MVRELSGADVNRTLVRLYDEEGQSVRAVTFTDGARAEEWGADMLGAETSFGLTVALARFYAEGENGGWILHGEMEY